MESQSLSSYQKSLRLLGAFLVVSSPTSFGWARDNKSWSVEDARPYVIRRDDNLTQVLFDLGSERIYGRRGDLARTLSFNPRLPQNGDILRPGQIVLIPGDLQRSSPRQRLASADPSAVPVPSVIPTHASEVAPRLPASAPSPAAVASSPAQAQAPAEASAQASALAFGRVRTRFGLSYEALEGVETANGTSGKLLSGLSPSLELGWQQQWDDSTATTLFIALTSVQFQNERRGIPLTDASQTVTALGLEYSRVLSDRLSLSGRFSYGGLLAYVGDANGGLRIEQLRSFTIRPEAEYVLVERAPFRLSGVLGLAYHGNASSDDIALSTGYSGRIGVRLAQEFARSRFDCVAAYDERRQNTDSLRLADKSIGLNCGYGWRY